MRPWGAAEGGGGDDDGGHDGKGKELPELTERVEYGGGGSESEDQISDQMLDGGRGTCRAVAGGGAIRAAREGSSGDGMGAHRNLSHVAFRFPEMLPSIPCLPLNMSVFPFDDFFSQLVLLFPTNYSSDTELEATI